ncbi:hypothetical protein OPW32_04265 [Vibrio europaeus]|uniref:hypothetical protein n=1 Tax=Vibrio europaeus TaxID=300876 RepID=UPI0023412938|nr:hypothetical protein [Vibrio europaeus]MDC5848423.1 hypothetical protein [Vibrio europaeus]
MSNDAFVTPIKDADGNTIEYQSVRSKPADEQVLYSISSKLNIVINSSLQIAAAVEITSTNFFWFIEVMFVPYLYS